MPKIISRNEESILKIRKFLGVNENPDGDTTLQMGEMATMRNFRVTKDNHLQIRPGCETVMRLVEASTAAGGETTPAEPKTRIRGVWRGAVAGTDHVLAAIGGFIYDVDLIQKTSKAKGPLTDDVTTFFGFEGKVYALNGHEYLSWDGGSDTNFESVEGYVPLVQTATTPAGEGTLLENVNRLTPKRRVQFSPDGSATEFKLPEGDIGSVDNVIHNGKPVTSFSKDLTKGTVTISPAPAAGTNTITITYSKGEAARGEVTGMHYSELFNGSNDTRVFLYGDGTNKTIYTGVDYDTGRPSAEYFPDLYEIAIGASNTPLTGLIRHYSRMMAFKRDSAWVIQQGTMTLESKQVTPAFYVLPVNRQFGNEAMGQATLLENSPLTLDVGSIYQWKNAGAAGGYVTISDSNAERISDRVAATLGTFETSKVRTFNLKISHECWFMYGNKAIILNYANDTWYIYEQLPFVMLLEVEDEVYGFSDDGQVERFSREYRNDNGREIECYAETGAMDFDRDWQLKYSSMIFVAMRPETNARVFVTVETNRRSGYPEKMVACSLSTFVHVNFNHFSFVTNRKPQVKRVKMKVKKATFYRLIFKSNSASATATVIEADIRLRYAGNVK